MTNCMNTNCMHACPIACMSNCMYCMSNHYHTGLFGSVLTNDLIRGNWSNGHIKFFYKSLQKYRSKWNVYVLLWTLLFMPKLYLYAKLYLFAKWDLCVCRLGVQVIPVRQAIKWKCMQIKLNETIIFLLFQVVHVRQAVKLKFMKTKLNLKKLNVFFLFQWTGFLLIFQSILKLYD